MRVWTFALASIATLVLPGISASYVPSRSLAPSLSSAFKRQAQCVDLCTSSSDVAALSSIASCNSDDLNCLCAAVQQLSQQCLFCILELDGVSLSNIQTDCPGETIGGEYSIAATDTGKPTASASLNTASTTTNTLLYQTTSAPAINITTCDSVCSSASDASASKDVLTCDGTTPTCICNAMSKLSRACFFCMLEVAGISDSTYDTLCSVASSPSTLGSQTTGLTASLATLTGASTLVQGVGGATSGSSASGSSSASAAASPSASHSSAVAERLGLHGMIVASLALLAALLLVMS